MIQFNTHTHTHLSPFLSFLCMCVSETRSHTVARAVFELTGQHRLASNPTVFQLQLLITGFTGIYHQAWLGFCLVGFCFDLFLFFAFFFGKLFRFSLKMKYKPVSSEEGNLALQIYNSIQSLFLHFLLFYIVLLIVSSSIACRFLLLQTFTVKRVLPCSKSFRLVRRHETETCHGAHADSSWSVPGISKIIPNHFSCLFFLISTTKQH